MAKSNQKPIELSIEEEAVYREITDPDFAGQDVSGFEEYLKPDEKILWRGKTRTVSAPRYNGRSIRIKLTISAVMAAFALLIVKFMAESGGNIKQTVVIAAIFLMYLLLILRKSDESLPKDFAITDERVIMKWLYKDCEKAHIFDRERIRKIKYIKEPDGGTLEVIYSDPNISEDNSSSSSSFFWLIGIEHPKLVQKLIQNLF